MWQPIGIWMRRTSVLALLVAMAGCATQLAPLYDKALVDGMAAANVDTMELLAAASSGTTRDSFSQREERYNRSIGELDALAVQAAARPVPSNDVAATVKKIVGSRNTPGDPGQVIPSATALHEISDTLSKMRDVDRKQGVTALEVTAFKGQILIYMDQAFTYEAALQR